MTPSLSHAIAPNPCIGLMPEVSRWRMEIGARPMAAGGVRFRVWAPGAERLSVKSISGEEFQLHKDEAGYFSCIAGGLRVGARYRFLFDDGRQYPDPASRSQPEGVHGPSEVIDPDGFVWEDAHWKGLPLREFIIYELHIGTFTPVGTFDAAMERIGYLKDLGITAVELMPVAQFPGGRNWGYDGVFLFAPQNTYGGPEGLKRFINACHVSGIAVILDVVYNHLGPEGNCLRHFGPYVTDRYKTPWGDAVNFDGPLSDEVRKFFISNALYWITEFHLDALRLDATHGIFDFGATHILQELAARVHAQGCALGRVVHVIAESDRNDVRLINPPQVGGYGLDAQWNDDFHHALHSLLTGESTGYYVDFGELRQLEKTMAEGFVYSGEYSKFRKRRHGSSTKDAPADRLIVFSQNHDQVGNRILGDRPRLTIGQQQLAAAAVLLSPYIPLVFMGEEYGETAPFQYFISHGDEALVNAVRGGRMAEFSAFKWQGELPDPQAETAFLSSKLDLSLASVGRHKELLHFYKRLIRLRKGIPALSNPAKGEMQVQGFEGQKALFVRRWTAGDEVCLLYNFSAVAVEVSVSIPAGEWVKVLDSPECGSPQTLSSTAHGIMLKGLPHGFVLYRKARGGSR